MSGWSRVPLAGTIWQDSAAAPLSFAGSEFQFGWQVVSNTWAQITEYLQNTVVRVKVTSWDLEGVQCTLKIRNLCLGAQKNIGIGQFYLLKSSNNLSSDLWNILDTLTVQSNVRQNRLSSLKVDCKYSVYFWSKVLNTYQIAHLDILLKFYYEIWKRTTPRVIFTEHGNTPNLGGFHHGAHCNQAPWKMSDIEDGGEYNFNHIVPAKLLGMPDAEFTTAKWNSCHIVPAYLTRAYLELIQGLEHGPCSGQILFIQAQIVHVLAD